jgi:imidazoleglycerol phosphate dehydratase HisB
MTSPFERITKETRVVLTLGGGGGITTSVPMLTHFLEQLDLYGGLGLTLQAEDLQPLGDGHHLTEDVAIALGRALDRDLGTREGRARYGQRLLPMDEALATVAVDIGGRPYPVVDIPFPSPMLGGLATENVLHFFRTLALEARFTLHLKVTGENAHHMAEAAFKGAGLALREAFGPSEGLRSTKGVLR